MAGNQTTNKYRADAIAREGAAFSGELKEKRKRVWPASPPKTEPSWLFKSEVACSHYNSSKPRPAEQRAKELEQNAEELIGATAQIWSNMCLPLSSNRFSPRTAQKR